MQVKDVKQCSKPPPNNTQQQFHTLPIKMRFRYHFGGLRASQWNRRLKEWESREPRKKQPMTFHYTGCLIGTLIIFYYNPYITG